MPNEEIGHIARRCASLSPEWDSSLLGPGHSWRRWPRGVHPRVAPVSSPRSSLRPPARSTVPAGSPIALPDAHRRFPLPQPHLRATRAVSTSRPIELHCQAGPPRLHDSRRAEPWHTLRVLTFCPQQANVAEGRLNPERPTRRSGARSAPTAEVGLDRIPKLLGEIERQRAVPWARGHPCSDRRAVSHLP